MTVMLPVECGDEDVHYSHIWGAKSNLCLGVMPTQYHQQEFEDDVPIERWEEVNE